MYSLPSRITESWDWQAHCSWQPALGKRVMPRGMSFLKALEQRLKLMDTAPPLGIRCFDLKSARLSREVKYATKQAAIGTEPLKECGTADARLFCLNQAFFKVEGFPSNSLRELDIIAPLLKKWERQTQHRVGHLVPFQQKEAIFFSSRDLSETYVKVPSWFSWYEVHYGLHVETPPIASYRARALMSDEQNPEWQIFLTEWAALATYELMYQGRQGRLHFLSTDLRGLIRDLGSNTLMFGRDDLARQLEILLGEIDVIKLSEDSPQNWALPDDSCDTHVSITGNWAASEAWAWETQMEDTMYLLRDEWGHKAFDHLHGSLTGLIDRRAEEKRTTRPARAGDECGVPQIFRLLELEALAGEVVREAPEVQ